tara:strand:+ start:118 stop:1908 length:1791 start_codon:yes stop_codon:yes gene_type:complete
MMLSYNAPTSTRPTRAAMTLLPIALLGLMACSSEDEPTVDATTQDLPPTAQAPDSIHIEYPEDLVLDLHDVETLTEETADWFLTFSDKLRKRDYAAAREWFADDFWGHALDDLEVATQVTAELDVTKIDFDAATTRIVNADDFMQGIESHLAPWSSVESVLWKVKQASFHKGRGTWGKLKLFIHATGLGPKGQAIALTGWGYAQATKRQGNWEWDRFELTSLETQTRKQHIFTEIAASAGVAHTGIRFGKPGNDSFHWNGVAAADVDQDGDWDLFVPSDGQNFLYIAQPNGKYTDEASARGVLGPDAGTGAVFADFDNDGDQDLLVSHVAWKEPGDRIGGSLIQLYRNDGTGKFTRQVGVAGLDQPYVGYSATVFDYDADGYLDVFICGYGRVEVEHNNSWIEATNGSPNALLRNLGGNGFRDMAPELGMAGTKWSYASAAADMNGDGHIDLYVANDYGSNELWVNQGDGTFVAGAEEAGILDQGNGMGVAFGDLTNDGKLDLYVSNMSSTAGNRILDRYQDELEPELYAQLKKAAAGNTIFFQGEDGHFAKQPKSAGGVGANWAWCTSLVDFDLDGCLDIFVTNGFVTGDQAFDT